MVVIIFRQILWIISIFLINNQAMAISGQEISQNLFDDPRSRVWNQAENRLHAQKGLLLELLK